MGMEFVPSDEGPRPTIAQPTPAPNFDETIKAAFRQGNSVVSAFQDMGGSGHYEPQEGYSAWDDIKDKPQYLLYAGRFAGFRSPAETQELMTKIDAEEHDKRTLAASGASGLLATLIAGTLDPTMLLPGRVAFGVAKEGLPFLRGAAEVGGAMAIQSTAQEMALQTSQATRPVSESVAAVGSATLLGALLGGAVARLSPAEHADLVTKLDRDRAALDAHVAGRPEPASSAASVELPSVPKGEDIDREYNALPDNTTPLARVLAELRGFGFSEDEITNAVIWARDNNRPDLVARALQLAKREAESATAQKPGLPEGHAKYDLVADDLKNRAEAAADFYERMKRLATAEGVTPNVRPETPVTSAGEMVARPAEGAPQVLERLPRPPMAERRYGDIHPGVMQALREENQRLQTEPAGRLELHPDVMQALQEEQRLMGAPRAELPESFPRVVLQRGPSRAVRLVDHPDFEAAKHGDIEAAHRVVQSAVTDKAIAQIKEQIGDRNPVLLPVVGATESGHFNVLPLAYAEELHDRLGFDVSRDISQVHRVHDTNAPTIVRIANKTGFEGKVEPGRDYYLVDDMVVHGSTLADLRGYIESNGGNVVGGTALIGSATSHILGPRAGTLAELRAKFPDLEAWWHEQFGHDFGAITENEARYLLKFKSVDNIRRSVLEAGRANDLGAASRTSGFWRTEGEGVRDIRRLSEEGKTAREIADLLGVSPSFIRSVMSRENIRSSQGQRPSGFWQEGGEGLAELKRLNDEGRTVDQMAEHFGLSEAGMHTVLSRTGVELKNPRKPGQYDRSAVQRGTGEQPTVASEWEVAPDGTMVRRLTSSAGAAATDIRTLEPVRTGVGLERVPFDLVMSTLQQPSIAGRRAMADLAEIATLVGENLRGETTTLGGQAPLETMARVITNQTNVAVHDELMRLWQDLRFGGGKAPVTTRLQLAFGLPERGGTEAAPTFEQFKTMVSDALMNGDRHATTQVEQAAKFVRAKVFEPWAERAEKAFPQFKRQDAEDYFPHVWNKNLIEARRPEFVNKLVAKYWTDQTAKRQAQVRLRSFQGALDSHETTIGKLTDRIDTRNAKLKEAQTELDEVQRANKAAFDRASELRRADTEAARQKGVELARQQTEIRNRVNKLADKVSGLKHEIEDLENRLQAEHLSANRVRERIEDEIGRWEGKSTSEAKSAIRAREKYEAERTAKAAAEGKPKPTERLRSADDAVDLAVKRILKTDQNHSLEDIRSRANETVDRILGSPDGRLAYDEHQGAPDFGPRPPGSQARGSLARRTLDVDNDFARGWVEQDIERVVRDHLRTFVPDTLLAERFGDVEMSAQMRDIEDEYSHMIDATKNESDRNRLAGQRSKTIENVAAVRDRFRGLYNIPTTAAARRLGRISVAVRNANVPLSLGMAAVSSIPDAAGAVFRWGMMAAFRDGWIPFVTSLMSNQELNREALRQFRTMGIAVDTFTAQRHREFSGLVEQYRPGSPVERTLQWGADKFQLLNMLGPWTDLVKSISSAVAAQELYRAADAVRAGNPTPKQLRALSENNITQNMALRIAEQYEKTGNVIDGVRLPNTESWTDNIAREAFEAALSREANIAVVTPGLDKPLLFSDPVASMLLQFKSFTAAATTRIMIANLQRADAETLQGLVASLAMGMVSYKINAITGGQPTSDRPQDWIKEAMSRGNVFGWLEEGNALASKMTRGGLDIYRLIGADKPLSKFAAQSAPEQLMGPTFGKLQAIAKATSGVAGREWDASDTKAVRRLIPMQNLPYLRQLFDHVEAGANSSLGVQQKVH